MRGVVISIRRLFVFSLVLLLAQAVVAQAPVSVTVLPNTISAGAAATGLIAFASNVKSAETITLSCSDTDITIPSTVSIAEGKQDVTFDITTKASAKSALATIKATADGGTALGFAMLQAVTVTYPEFAAVTFTPSIVLSGQSITGTIGFTQPLLTSMTFDLSSGNANFTVPASVAAKKGASSVTFSVKVGTGACTGAVTVKASLAAGSYTNVWTGALSASGSFAYLAGEGLPPNYAAGFWQGTLIPYPDEGTGYYFLPNLNIYPDGRFATSGSEWFYRNSSWNHETDTPYIGGSGRIGSNGAIYLESVGNSILFPVETDDQSCLFDASTITFSADGTTATLKVVAQLYTYTESANPTLVFGDKVTLGTYTFTRVQ